MFTMTVIGQLEKNASVRVSSSRQRNVPEADTMFLNIFYKIVSLSVSDEVDGQLKKAQQEQGSHRRQAFNQAWFKEFTWLEYRDGLLYINTPVASLSVHYSKNSRVE